MYDVEAERDQIISMILDGKEIVTIKKISSFFNKDLEYCKKLFIELLAYLSQNNSYSSLNACVCCFQVKNISETVKEKKISIKNQKIKNISPKDFGAVLSVQLSKIKDYKLILNSNYKENNSFIFYQKFLNKTIHTNAARAHTPEIKNVPICQNSSKTSSPKKSLTLQKRKSTSAPHVKEKPSNVVETKPQPISSILEDVHIPAPICQSSQKECSDEEPLPKHLNTDSPTQPATIRKRVCKERHYTNEKGFLVTEKYYDYEEKEAEKIHVKPQSSHKTSKKPDNKNTSQYSLTNFFRKT